MKFRIEDTFENISVDEYERLYFDEEFNIAMCDAVSLEREFLNRDEDPHSISRKLKIAPDRELPPPIAKILGDSKLRYTEILNYNKDNKEGTWETISAIMTEKIDSRGTFRFEASGSGVNRIVEGDIKVKIFGLGSSIEKMILADVEKSYEAATDFTRRWLKKT